MKNPIAALRRVAIWEGVSYLLLLGIAMPLKYAWGKPMAVKIIGMAHGILFVMFCLLLAWVWHKAKWPTPRVVILFIASLLPFGPFIADRKMSQWEADYAAGRK